MPERIERLRSTLRELEDELATLESLDPQTREMLETTIAEIHEALRKSPGTAFAHDQTAVSRLQEAATAFESSHPTITGILARMIHTLGQMGI